MNTVQEEAVDKVLRTKDAAIAHGPPGIGKTIILVGAVYEALHRENQVLACVQNNITVDWIAEELVDHGVSVPRIDSPSWVNDKMLSFIYERCPGSHLAYTESWDVRKSIRDIGHHMRKKGYPECESTRNRALRLKERATEFEILISEDLFSSARVIASTPVSGNHRILTGRHFNSLFVNEATQALEAACWMAI